MAEKQDSRPKLRETCNCCAQAKVKCSKDKPTCRRCQEKKLNCSYALSNRYGRLPSSARAANRTSWSVNSRIEAANPAPRRGRSEGCMNVSRPNDCFQCTGVPISPISTSEVDSDMLNNMSYPNLECDPTTIIPYDFEEIQWNSMQGSDLFSPTEHDLMALDTMTSSGPSSQFSQFGSPTSMHPLMHESLSNNMPTVRETEPHSCLRTSTSLLLQLRRGGTIPDRSMVNNAPLSTTSGEGSHRFETAHENFGDLQSPVDILITMNRQALEQCMTILVCKCSMLEEVTIILTLIAFQVLRRYANIPRIVPNLSEIDQNTIAALARLVLGDLHRFLPLIEILERRWGKLKPTELAGGLGDHAMEGGDGIPLNILKGLEAELKGRLQKVNEEMVAIVQA